MKCLVKSVLRQGWILAIVVLMISACQTTPEELVVQSKADDDLKNAIAQTAKPAIQTEAPTAEPIIVNDTSANPSGTVEVIIDAEVINHQPARIPVAVIAPKIFTPDDVKQMAQAFFGNTQLYESVWSKADYDSYILDKQYELSNEEALQFYVDDYDISLSEARAKIQNAIERAIEGRKNAPDDGIPLDSFAGVNSEMGLYALIKTNENVYANIKADRENVLFVNFNDNERYYIPREMFPIELIPTGSQDAAFLKAKQMAIDMAANMGIDGVALGVTYSVQDSSHLNSDVPKAWNGRTYTVFCFEKQIGDSSLDHTLEIGALSYAKEEVYEDLRPYERLEIWMEGEQFVQFRYTHPMVVKKILNEQVAIGVDYSKAVELAKQYAYTRYIDEYGNYTDARLNIEKIELIMARTRELNNGNYIVVPAWNFCGTLSRKFKPELAAHQGADEDGWVTELGNWGGSDTLITINALDGTVIDMAHGY